MIPSACAFQGSSRRHRRGHRCGRRRPPRGSLRTRRLLPRRRRLGCGSHGRLRRRSRWWWSRRRQRRRRHVHVLQQRRQRRIRLRVRRCCRIGWVGSRLGRLGSHERVLALCGRNEQVPRGKLKPPAGAPREGPRRVTQKVVSPLLRRTRPEWESGTNEVKDLLHDTWPGRSSGPRSSSRSRERSWRRGCPRR